MHVFGRGARTAPRQSLPSNESLIAGLIRHICAEIRFVIVAYMGVSLNLDRSGDHWRQLVALDFVAYGLRLFTNTN